MPSKTRQKRSVDCGLQEARAVEYEAAERVDTGSGNRARELRREAPEGFL